MQGMSRSALYVILIGGSLLWPRELAAAEKPGYVLTFDHPMSWADDIAPWGLGGVQQWEVAEGGRPGGMLRISAAAYAQPISYEVRTLQFNHEPGRAARISFDIRPHAIPKGASCVIRYFDGYCGAFPFIKVADDPFAPFPKPIWDSDTASRSDEWQTVSIETDPLKHTVLTLAILVRQPHQESREGDDAEYIEVHMDNLHVDVPMLRRFMDPGFDWHGNGGSSTIQFRHNTRAADADWCDFIDQQDVETPDGVIHYRLLPFRSSSTYPDPGWNVQISHDVCAPDVGGHSVIALRGGGDRGCAVSWGVRQTVSYDAFGLGPREKARLRVRMKMTNHDPLKHGISRVQLGVDPHGGIVTSKAKWSREDNINAYEGGWRIAELTFDRPPDAEAVTIFFRRRDGTPRPAPASDFPEKQSQGTPGGASGMADWVMVDVVDVE